MWNASIEARDCLHLIGDVEDREAMQELTLSILELVKQVRKLIRKIIDPPFQP